MDGVATHRVGAIDTVQFEVQAARIAHHLASQVATPDRSCGRSAVGTGEILLRALLVVVCVLRAIVVVVVAFRDFIRAGPQVIASGLA